MNYLCLIGNFTRDPELRQTPAGVSVLNFSIGLSDNYKRKDGTVEKKSTFVDCEAWDSGAELIAENFRKGDKILIEGKLRTDSWEVEVDGQTQKRSKLKVRVNSFEFLEHKKKREESENTFVESTS